MGIWTSGGWNTRWLTFTAECWKVGVISCLLIFFWYNIGILIALLRFCHFELVPVFAAIAGSKVNRSVAILISGCVSLYILADTGDAAKHAVQLMSQLNSLLS